MRVSATDAKNRFGYYLGAAEHEPVHVVKDDRVAIVMVSAARYAQLEALEIESSSVSRENAGDEGRREWIKSQNELVEKIGVFGEELRPW
jgi:prevent-host-death family protein